MTPHATSEVGEGTQAHPYRSSIAPCDASDAKDQFKASGPTNGVNHSHLRATDIERVHDLVGVGFGPASLAIAVALHDALDESPKNLSTRHPKVAFLERQSHFAWHSGMLLPGATMQISFLKDLATLRNPRSQFTFLNYLQRQNRLVQFINLSTFLPRRIEYEDYMRWCASWFEEVVDYNEEVVEILPERSNTVSKRVDVFAVVSHNRATGMRSVRKAKNVVIAVGGKPAIPAHLPQSHPRVIHSSQYSIVIPKLFPDITQAIKIAIIGSGQSAAELFQDVQNRYPNSQSLLIIRGAALRPSDDSPFVNEIFDPDRVDGVFAQSPEVRAEALKLDRGTNYGVVRLGLLEEIYSDLYAQRIQHRHEDEWPHRIINHRTVDRIEDTPNGPRRLRLHLTNNSAAYSGEHGLVSETIDADLVLVASGYRRDAYEDLLRGMRHLMPGGDEEGKRWEVSRDYRVRFESGTVSDGSGVWLQGCNESSHGLSDTLLSILATRGGEMVQSIFGNHGTYTNGVR
ncbi:hypothetical protein LTR50_000244 [Elasticomyces elasticus]|nr:hypothetical protein LTR50_000244 [Elasticomyces elasticus]